MLKSKLGILIIFNPRTQSTRSIVTQELGVCIFYKIIKNLLTFLLVTKSILT